MNQLQQRIVYPRVYAAASDGNLPRFLAKLDPKTGVPRRALVALFVLVMVSLTAYYAAGVDVNSAFLATSGAALMVYVVGSAAGIKLLGRKGVRGLLPWASLIVSLILLPFIGPLLIASLPVAVLGLVYGLSRSRQIELSQNLPETSVVTWSEPRGESIPADVAYSLAVSASHLDRLADTGSAGHGKGLDVVGTVLRQLVPLLDQKSPTTSPEEPGMRNKDISRHPEVNRVGHEEGVLERPVVSTARPDGQIGPVPRVTESRTTGCGAVASEAPPCWARPS